MIASVDLRTHSHRPRTPRTHANWRHLAESVDYADDVDKPTQLLLCDAQTSGGLLITVAPEKLDDLLAALSGKEVATAEVVGSLVAGPPRIRVTSG